MFITFKRSIVYDVDFDSAQSTTTPLSQRRLRSANNDFAQTARTLSELIELSHCLLSEVEIRTTTPLS